jgi:2-polyprenyl-3-methyl-5-hydroxy-6-metoxy-1,4-benzoquinol methylase
MECRCEFGDHESGARYRRFRCQKHRSSRPVTNVFTEESYRRMGSFDEKKTHINEFIAGFGEMGSGAGSVLEIGCGISQYVKMCLEKGFRYEGCDTSKFACEWMKNTYGVRMYQKDFEVLSIQGQYDIVIAAHVLEHAKNAAKMMEKVSSAIIPGGLLYLLIPDDADLENQDHNWFFTEESAMSMMKLNGFEVLSSRVFRIVSHENFMYLVGKKK